MAINQLIAKKYALAAFSLAKKSNLIDQFLGDLKKFSDFFSNSTIKELSNPAISRVDLGKMVVELGEKLSLNNKVIAFLETVAGSRRISGIKLIEKHFSKLVKVEKNILEVELISAIQLDEQTIQEVRSTLQKQYSKLTIEIEQTIKKDILGGLIIKIGSNMIDASLKRQLDALKIELDQAICQAI
jgi:F-type H+-transporting ATPase subunit delta